PRPKADWSVNQPSVQSMLEEAACVLNQLATKTMRSPVGGHLVPQSGKILRVQVRDQSAFPEVGNHQVANLLVVGPGAGRYFPRINQRLLIVQKGIRGILDCQSFGIGLRLAAGVQGVFLGKVLLQGGVGVIPRAEVIEAPPDLLRPLAAAVSVQRELTI